MSICPTGCGRSVGLGNLLCATCWHLVPPALAAEVWRTWRAFQKDRRSREACNEYRSASDAAIAAVKERVTQKELSYGSDE